MWGRASALQAACYCVPCLAVIFSRIGTDACSGDATWFVSTRAVTNSVCSAGAAFSSATISNSRLS